MLHSLDCLSLTYIALSGEILYLYKKKIHSIQLYIQLAASFILFSLKGHHAASTQQSSPHEVDVYGRFAYSCLSWAQMHPPPHLWDPGSGAGNGNPICNSAGLLWDAVPLRMGSILHFSRLWVGSCGG